MQSELCHLFDEVLVVTEGLEPSKYGFLDRRLYQFGYMTKKLSLRPYTEGTHIQFRLNRPNGQD